MYDSSSHSYLIDQPRIPIISSDFIALWMRLGDHEFLSSELDSPNDAKVSNWIGMQDQGRVGSEPNGCDILVKGQPICLPFMKKSFER